MSLDKQARRKTALSGSPPGKRATRLVKLPRGRPPVYSRDEILRAAKIAFSQDGYANVSLDQLAARLNTGKGTIYYHSNRKIDLLIAISRTFISASIPSLRRIQALKIPADTRFAMALRSLMNDIISDLQASKIYFENEADLPPPIRAELRGVLREIEDIFIQVVNDGRQVGMFTCDPIMAVRHVMAIAAWPYRWYSPAGALNKEEFIDTAVDFALSGLTGAANATPLSPSPRAAPKVVRQKPVSVKTKR
jgi:AcrR family transcriptional regulator